MKKTALRDTKCTGGADEFIFLGRDGRDLTTSDPSKMDKFCGEAGKLARSLCRIQSVVYNVVLSCYLDVSVCCVGYD